MLESDINLLDRSITQSSVNEQISTISDGVTV